MKACALRPRLVVVLAGLLTLLREASADCQSHCAYPCVELNGPLDVECGNCNAEDYSCYPGAPDFDTWKQRQDALRVGGGGGGGGMQMVSMDANGNQVAIPEDDGDEEKPIELTHKSMVMRDKFFNLASKKRTAEMGFDKFEYLLLIFSNDVF